MDIFPGICLTSATCGLLAATVSKSRSRLHVPDLAGWGITMVVWELLKY